MLHFFDIECNRLSKGSIFSGGGILFHIFYTVSLLKKVVIIEPFRESHMQKNFFVIQIVKAT